MAKRWLAWSPNFALGLILLLILLASTIPARPAIAATEGVKWLPVNIPTDGRLGNWVLAAGSDVQHLTMAIDGALYAYAKGLTYTLYKSTNGGYSWSYLGNVTDSIVDIATSPHDANLVYYATRSYVYRSNDGGKTFVQLPGNPGGAGSNNLEITALDVTWLNYNVIAASTRDTDNAQFGGVYTLNEEQILAGWTDTGLSGYDIYAVAFSPNYAGDRQLIAVASDETDTYVTTKINNAGWGATAGNARLNKDNSMPPASVAVATSAAIAFPSNYDANPAWGNYVQFIAVDTGTGSGDVYKINGAAAPASSAATDLNIGSAYGLKNIDVTGLAVSGGGNSARLLAGAAASAQTYSSTDGGLNWTRSNKAPSGTSKTYVFMAAGPGGKTYAATSGSESALSISQDYGVTYNQIGLIDTTVSTIVDLAPSPIYSRDNTLFMLTFGGKHSLWRSTSGGTSWERVFSSALADVDSINLVELSPQYGNNSRVVFIAGSSNSRPAIWQSIDSGQKFNCRPAFDPTRGTPLSIDAWATVNDTSLFIGSYDGSNGLVYLTTNSGFFYSTGTLAGSQPLNSIVLSPDYDKDKAIQVGNTNGWVYWSGDNGASFEPLPPNAASPPLTDAVAIAFDSQFGSTRTVYAASSTANKGVYRFIVGKSADWESIDGTLPGGGMLNQLMVSTDGVLYAANSKAGGGMERCLDPNYPLGPTFETVTRGLSSGATLVGLWQNGHILWSIDTSNVKLMTFIDTLTLPATLTSPANAASGIGSLNNLTFKNVSLDWGALREATSYQWQLNYNTDFSVIPSAFDGVTNASSAHLPTLEPGATYYWRVRASAPVLSPWAAKWSFTTSLDTEVTTLQLASPKAGATGVPVKPLFQWSAVAGADAYELVASTDSSFANPLIAKLGGDALPTTTWQCNLSLKYDTSYYWKVRAINANTSSAWSAVSTFTVEPPSATPPMTTPPPPTVTLEPIIASLPRATTAPIAASLPMATPSPTATPQPTPAAPVQAPSPVPVPPAPSQSAPAVLLPAPLPTITNWIVLLIAALLLIIILLLIILLMLVVRPRY